MNYEETVLEYKKKLIKAGELIEYKKHLKWLFDWSDDGSKSDYYFQMRYGGYSIESLHEYLGDKLFYTLVYYDDKIAEYFRRGLSGYYREAINLSMKVINEALARTDGWYISLPRRERSYYVKDYDAERSYDKFDDNYNDVVRDVVTRYIKCHYINYDGKN